MPELPEVEVVRSGLDPAVTGATVARVEVLEPRSLRRHDGPSEDFVARLTGARLGAPARRGKFLWIPVVSDRDGSDAAEASRALLIHLGMSGQVLLRASGADRERSTRIVLDLERADASTARIHFVDQRIFGSMALDELIPTRDHPEQRVPRQVAHIARDPLDAHFDDVGFLRRLAARDTGIKRALLDQTLVSGIGNIYADEALWSAGIHYDHPTRRLTRPRARILLAEVRLVLGRALAEGGTSFDAQYVNVNGASGYFSHSLNAYGQTGRACPRCGTPIVREQFMNRGSHFCPRCQRLPRRSTAPLDPA